MVKKLSWSEDADHFLRENYHLTNKDLAKRLGVSHDSVRLRYRSLGIDRPSGKNELARARGLFCRTRLAEKVPQEWHELPITRADAKNADVSFYWDGQPCNRAGHISRRKTSSAGCWDCDYGDQKQKISSDSGYRSQRSAAFKRWYDKNRDDYLHDQRVKKKDPASRAWSREYEKNRRSTDIGYKLAKSLRDRLYKAISRHEKSDSAVNLVGCSIGELKIYLEEKFQNGMDWENYGQWHIDHIRPCSSFDLSDQEQQQACFLFTNLRPLWGEENISKGGIWLGQDPRRRVRKLQE